MYIIYIYRFPILSLFWLVISSNRIKSCEQIPWKTNFNPVNKSHESPQTTLQLDWVTELPHDRARSAAARRICEGRLESLSWEWYLCIYNKYLVGGFNHLEKYESQWEGLSHILWKKKRSKPPTSVYIYIYWHRYIDIDMTFHIVF